MPIASKNNKFEVVIVGVIGVVVVEHGLFIQCAPEHWLKSLSLILWQTKGTITCCSERIVSECPPS